MSKSDARIDGGNKCSHDDSRRGGQPVLEWTVEGATLESNAGLGARVHDSGQTHHTGRITKAGRRDLRWILVQAANHASRTHPHWQAELKRLEPRLGRSKAIVAIARKLLISVWHVLTDGCVDRFAEPKNVACSFFGLAYKVGVRNLPNRQSAKAFTRAQLDRLQIGGELEIIPWGTKQVKLPQSKLTDPKEGGEQTKQ